MIIFGTQSSHRLTESIFERCKECNQSNVQEVLVFQKYGHLYFIPFLPSGKEVVVRCRNCQNRIREKELSLELYRSSEEVKKHVKTAWWTYTGLLSIVGIVLLILFFPKTYINNTVALIKKPMPGDVYEIDLPDNYYTLYLVDDVRKDTVFLIMNSHQVDQSVNVSDLNYKGDFNSLPFPVLHKEVVKMFVNGEIMDVERNGMNTKNRISPPKSR